MVPPDPLLAVLRRSQEAGFLGPGPVEAHVDQATVFVEAAGEPPASFLDLGSGGGVPGLVLATAWPSATGMLIDAQARRVRFLEAAILELGVGGRMTAVHGRAEELAHDPTLRGRFDVVTARSFGPPAVAAECGRGFLRPGGLLLVAEPPGALGRWPHAGLAFLGLVDAGQAASFGGSVRRLRAVGAPPERVPRRPAAIRRRPAF